MKRILYMFGFSIMLASSILVHTDPILTMFFKNYPDVQSMMEKLKRPHGIAKHHLNELFNPNPIAGIFGTYFGFLNASNQNGQIEFPRKQSSTKVQLVISNKITPIMMFQNTISHWEVEAGTPADFYLLEQKTDESTELTFWEVQKIATPENNQISSTNSLIIIAKPKNVYVPTGITIAQETANLLLPDVYVKRGIQSVRNALYVMNLSLFFQPIDLLYKKGKTKYEQLIKE